MSRSWALVSLIDPFWPYGLVVEIGLNIFTMMFRSRIYLVSGWANFKHITCKPKIDMICCIQIPPEINFIKTSPNCRSELKGLGWTQIEEDLCTDTFGELWCDIIVLNYLFGNSRYNEIIKLEYYLNNQSSNRRSVPIGNRKSYVRLNNQIWLAVEIGS